MKTITETETARTCSVHTHHEPRNLTVELHHVVPVAWQLKVPPASLPDPQPSPGPDTEGRGQLWDDRGVWICPTGHRNVHHLIVVMATAAREGVFDLPDVFSALTANQRRMPEASVALAAFHRFSVVGDWEAVLRGFFAENEMGQS